MREAIIYYAYDGSEFDNREKCEAYENEAFVLLTEVFNSYTFFINNQGILFFPNDVETGLHIFGKAFDKCDRILVIKPISDAAFRFMDSQLGYILPPNAIGLYRYDTDKFEWVKVDE